VKIKKKERKTNSPVVVAAVAEIVGRVIDIEIVPRASSLRPFLPEYPHTNIRLL
tara:strand:- start:1460 stop:1621 length:162 start_codon:yes stop_codon:yes gene_type:complete